MVGGAVRHVDHPGTSWRAAQLGGNPGVGSGAPSGITSRLDPYSPSPKQISLLVLLEANTADIAVSSEYLGYNVSDKGVMMVLLPKVEVTPISRTRDNRSVSQRKCISGSNCQVFNGSRLSFFARPRTYSLCPDL